MKVRFSDPAEFLEELHKDAALIDRSIVRLAYRYTPVAALGGAIHSCVMVASARIGDTVVVLERYIGQTGYSEKHDNELRERAQKEGKKLEQDLTLESRFEVRAGVLEE